MDHHNHRTSPSHRHLVKETVMRIEVSLSSRKSSVVVFNTTARVVALGNGEWSSVAYGAPCIVLLRDTIALDSPFQVKFVIAELESGLSVWEQALKSDIDYVELQPGFHSFKVNRQTMAVQFADSAEAFSFYNSMKQYLDQKEKVDQMLEEKKLRQAAEKKQKKERRKSLQGSKKFSKTDISLPCEFRHLSGITSGHTEVCQRELQSTMDRQRSASMGALSQKQAKQRPRLPSDMIDGSLYSSQKQIDKKQKKSSPSREKKGGSQRGEKKSGSQRGKFTFSSFRLVKKKRPLLFQDDYYRDDMELNTSSSVSQRAPNDPLPNPDSPQRKRQERGISLPPLLSLRSSYNDRESNAAMVDSTNTSPSYISQGWKDDSSSRTSTSYSSNQVDHAPLPSPTRVPLQPVINHIKPTFNTYDTLEPLNAKPKQSLLPLGKQGAPNLVAMMSPLQPENSKPTFTKNQSPVHHQIRNENCQNMTHSPSPVDNSTTTATVATSDSKPKTGLTDIESLTEELSKVLQEFDELISPMSPLADASSFTFQQATSTGKETML